MSEFLTTNFTSAMSPKTGYRLESPSLFSENATAEEPGAFEIKFLITELQANQLETSIRGPLTLDPHADPRHRSYRTTTLYTDTAAFDVFRRVGKYGNSKLRVRRYGSSGPLFLERKDKSGDKVRKSRVSVPPAELALLGKPDSSGEWIGKWFHDELRNRRLAPVCRISYDRIAYLGVAEGSAVRVTFDRMVQGELAPRWESAPVVSGPELLPGLVICEFKFRSSMPLLFKEIVEALGLNPTTCSKYRRYVETTGIAPPVDPATPTGDTTGRRVNG